ncbi:MAG: D-alanine--D-alanine ligase [Candidatus Moraniibacteriota bacterium]
MEKSNVAVLCGGFSGERQISLLSGENVMKYLDRDKYQVSHIDVVSETEWHWLGEDGTTHVLDLAKDEDLAVLKTVHVFFNALHGTYGEDGTVQTFLDSLGVPYTGSGVATSTLTIDKAKTMEYVAKAGIVSPEFFCVTDEEAEGVAEKISASFGYPAIIKPNDSGSTLGLTLVQNKDDVAEALDKAGHVSKEIIVQRYIFGREFTCGVLGNATDQDLILLPPIEIVIKNQVFDFNDKYFSKETQELCPAPIDKFLTAYIQKQALLAHRTLGCDGLSRSDFRMDGTNKLFFLETNTSPGFTAVSLCSKAAAAAGISMPHFLDRIIDLALSKSQEKAE